MDIRDLREQIDRLDDQILGLLNRRAALALQGGEAKRIQGRPIHDPDRENEVLSRLSSHSSGPLSTEAVQRIFAQIIEESRMLQESESR